jgi:hypothetical protein
VALAVLLCHILAIPRLSLTALMDRLLMINWVLLQDHPKVNLNQLITPPNATTYQEQEPKTMPSHQSPQYYPPEETKMKKNKENRKFNNSWLSLTTSIMEMILIRHKASKGLLWQAKTHLVLLLLPKTTPKTRSTEKLPSTILKYLICSLNPKPRSRALAVSHLVQW